MLVLSRKRNEAIVISTKQGEITVQVVETRGEQVRLGIECSKDIPVHRKEVLDAIKENNNLANHDESLLQYQSYVGTCVEDSTISNPVRPIGFDEWYASQCR
jgi:carbon storage regulator